MMETNVVSIIGGSGFVGTNLCQYLVKRKIPFEIIDIRPSAQFSSSHKFGDVRDIESLRRSISGTVVINLAAVHRDNIRDKAEYHKTNVIGAKNVTSVCSEKKIHKIIFTSTVAVYGSAQPGTTEDGKINPSNEYGKTKFEAEKVFQEWLNCSPELNSLLIVRPTVIFGEGNRGNVFNLLNQISTGRFIMVGKGCNKKSMAYVGNVVAFLHTCLDTNNRYVVYNYVDTPDMDMNSLVRIARKKLTNRDHIGIRIPYWLGMVLGHFADLASYISGRNFPVSALRIRKFCATTEFSSRKDTLSNFSAPYSLEEGIERTLEKDFINTDEKHKIFSNE